MHKLVFFLIIISLFASCNNDLSDAQKKEYIAQGKTIAQSTAKGMLKEVSKNIKEGGPKQALSFCHAHAEEITKDFSSKNGVEIKRTSHKIRNEKNVPNQREQQVIDLYLSQNPNDIKPIVEKNEDGSVQFYAPIILLDKCTACHGVAGETMKVETDSVIKFLYPNDKAFGFKEGDIRGIWSIKFPKK